MFQFFKKLFLIKVKMTISKNWFQDSHFVIKMKKLFLMFMLLTPFAMAYGERNEIIVSPIYGKQKNNNDKNAPVKGVTGSGIKISLEGKGGVDDVML